MGDRVITNDQAFNLEDLSGVIERIDGDTFHVRLEDDRFTTPFSADELRKAEEAA